MSGLERRVRRIAIFGKSHELWPVAALLAKDLPADIELIVVEDGRPVDPAAVTIRLDDISLARLGIGPDQLKMTDSAIFSLGVELRGWQGDDSRFFLTGSGNLPPILDIPIHQIMLRAALAYDQPDRFAYLYQPFRLPARAMEAGRFAFQSTDPRSPLSMLRPTVQIDRADYTSLLRNSVTSGKSEIVEARPKAIEMSAADQSIDRIALDSGQAIEADFYIDVSGAVASLTNGFSRSDWHSLAETIPFDRISSARGSKLLSGTERHVVAQAFKGGLTITTPLRNGSIVRHLYASSLPGGEEERVLAGADANVAPSEPGFVRQPWTGNLVRLGGASASFGPFLSANMMLLQHQAMILADHLPTRSNMSVEAKEYNRRHLIVAEQLRDFVLFPFALNRRNDAPWCRIQEEKMPESLIRKIDQFRSRGRLVTYDGEMFDEQSWIDLMIGFGLIPDRIDPIALSLDMTDMARRLKNLSRAFDQALAAMPSNEDVEP